MKKYLILFSLLIASCNKSNQDYCENLILGSPEIHLVNDKQLDTIKFLMNTNRIDYSNLQFWQYANMGAAIYISAYQYVNGLKVFTEGISFWQKKSETSIEINGDRITNIDVTNLHLMIPRDVRTIFLNKVANDEIMKKANIEVGSCVDLEFGYYNLNVHDITLPKSFTTAWRVTPKDKIYPWAYINDQNGDILEYWDGICTN